ncbi:hypothetical protein DWG20_00200 [Crenobacter cavernae]|uniref:Replication-associated protein ORF2/G2P domain-containing protein n=1 Tax=Crenobacter cavernae TaxID=2290923 RepID=A0A345YA18_9NEIS|nr:hypothetical protein DWG20_00200 [Crenobacter cavernae]
MPSAASVTRFAELVKKIETSATPSARKRKTAARRKLSRVIREQRRDAKAAKRRAVVVTLTYSDRATYTKKHISAFVDALRGVLHRLGHRFPYAWVFEKAGQLHYHLMLWLPRGYKLDFARLEKWWPWGSTWVESCRSVKAWERYMAKFDSMAKLPKGARFCGHGGLDEAGKTAVARAGMPRWLTMLLPAGHRARRCPGGGWVDSVTGEIYRSPYVWTPRGAVLAAISPPTCHLG